jgi:TPR repeat protein
MHSSHCPSAKLTQQEVRGPESVIHSTADFTETSVSRTGEKIAMSEEEAAAADEVCASCGQAEIDDIKLKLCDGGCDLVKYCSVDCQESNREQHNGECKTRRAELRDNDLFTQPDISHLGECPICCLPLPIDPKKSLLMTCCSQSICMGCDGANQKREYEAGLEKRCAFCREPLPKPGSLSEEIHQKRLMKRVKKNCPVAMREMGRKCYNEGNYETAFNYWTNAAELGDADAHYSLAVYNKGQGVEKDEKKKVYHLEEAAIGGHPKARRNLGVEELENHKVDRARKHFIIAANLGHDASLKVLMQFYAKGHASKEDYLGALRGYQAAVEATKSSDRETAEEAIKNGEVIL